MWALIVAIAATTYSPGAVIAPGDRATLSHDGVVAAQLFYNLDDRLGIYWVVGNARIAADSEYLLGGCGRGSGRLFRIPVPPGATAAPAATLHVEVAGVYGEAHVQRTFALAANPPATTPALPALVALDGRHVVADAAYFVIETAETQAAWRDDDIHRVHVLGPSLHVPCVDPAEREVIRVEAVMTDGSVREGYLDGHGPPARSLAGPLVLGVAALAALAVFLHARARRWARSP